MREIDRWAIEGSVGLITRAERRASRTASRRSATRSRALGLPDAHFTLGVVAHARAAHRRRAPAVGTLSGDTYQRSIGEQHRHGVASARTAAALYVRAFDRRRGPVARRLRAGGRRACRSATLTYADAADRACRRRRPSTYAQLPAERRRRDDAAPAPRAAHVLRAGRATTTPRHPRPHRRHARQRRLLGVARAPRSTGRRTMSNAHPRVPSVLGPSAWRRWAATARGTSCRIRRSATGAAARSAPGTSTRARSRRCRRGARTTWASASSTRRRRSPR